MKIEKSNRLQMIKASMARDAEFVLNMLSNIPGDITHDELMALAVDVMVDACVRVKSEIWTVKGSSINLDLLKDGTISRGERLVAEAAISLWTYGESSIELWTILNKLDVENSRNFIRAIMLIHHWDAAELEAEEIETRRIIRGLQDDED